jgi:uncharacterized membrane protein
MHREYIVLSLVNLVIWAFAIFLPFFASALDSTRLFHMTIIVLSPYFVIGGTVIIRKILRWVPGVRPEKSHLFAVSVKCVAVFLAVYLLLSAGWVNEVARDRSTSLALNTSIDYPIWEDQEIIGAKWIAGSKGEGIIYADEHRWLLPASLQWNHVKVLSKYEPETPPPAYFYLGAENLDRQGILILDVQDPEHHSDEAMKLGSLVKRYINAGYIINTRGKIYANGGSEVYH